jgi:hypothetical protein
MDTDFVRNVAASKLRDASQLARAVMSGQRGADNALHDCLEEQEITRMDSLQTGKSYLVQTVTHYYTGRLMNKSLSELVLEEAAWIPSTGRFHEALRTGTLEEVEPFVDPVTVNLGAVVAVTPWRHALPREAR